MIHLFFSLMTSSMIFLFFTYSYNYKSLAGTEKDTFFYILNFLLISLMS